MSSVVRSIRASAEEWQAWQAAAGDLSLNTWVRQSLNEQTQLAAALDRVTEPEPVLQVPVAVTQVVAAVRERTGKCLAFTPRGTRCKVCGKTH